MKQGIGILILVVAVGAACLWAGSRYAQEIGQGITWASHTLHLTSQSAEKGEKGAGKGGEEEKEEAASKVKVAKLVRGKIERTITAYGTVAAMQGETHTFTVPFECRVAKVRVQQGQVVEAGASLVEVEASPDARLALDSARDEAEAAKSEIKLFEQRLEMKLGTRLELLAAQQKLAAAAVKVKSLEARGLEKPVVLNAEAAGIVSKLGAQPGQIVPLGTALVEMVAENQIAVRLGFEGDDAGRLKPGQPVRLLPLRGPKGQGVEGKIALVTRQFDPQTRLVTVFATPVAGAKLLLDDFLECRVPVEAHEGLLAPRAAALPEEDHFILFTVEKEHAVRHVVKLGIQGEKEVEVTGEKLKEGVIIVTMGAGELKDGMQVEAEPSR